ncbi:MAG: hypothetical protein AAF355_12470 [Myxococcota bacterium]
MSTRIKLPEKPTVQDVLLAVAGLGGHLKRNGRPGWLTIDRGFDELLTSEVGWYACPLGRSRPSAFMASVTATATTMATHLL